MLALFKRNKAFFIPYLVLLIFSLIILSVFDKGQIHIAINQLHNDFFDSFFKYYTYLGDDAILISVTVLFFFINYRHALMLTASNIAATIVVQYFKRILCGDLPRPLHYFRNFYDGDYQLYLVQGVDVGIWYPFPSGHTKAAFMLFLFFVLILPEKMNKNVSAMLKFSFFVFACLVGYSRMYLSQHFFMDVVGGSLVGIVFIVTFYYYFSKAKAELMNKSLIHTFRKKAETFRKKFQL